MQDGVRNVFTYYILKTLYLYYICSFELSNIQGVWFGTTAPISYTVIPGKNSVVSTPLSQLTDKPHCGQL